MCIAIIGHGRSPEHQGWGVRIDACRVVLRMWDWTWQERADYGTKYDFGFFEIDDTMLVNFNRHNKRQPTIGWVGSLLNQARRAIPARTEIISQEPWVFEGRRMGGAGATGRLQFTRGTIAALWMMTRYAAPQDEVVLVGFDNVWAGQQLPLEQAFCKQYQNNPGTFPMRGYKPGVKYGNHDFSIERPLIEAIAKRHGVKLSFSQQVWQEAEASNEAGPTPPLSKA